MRSIKTSSLLLLFFLIPGSYAWAWAGNPALAESGGMHLADVNIHERPKALPKLKVKTKPKVIPHKVKQYEIEGYMDKKYVRVVLEVEKKGRIVGNIYDKQGKGIYVHGEYQEGALYVYDDEGTEYTIVVE